MRRIRFLVSRRPLLPFPLLRNEDEPPRAGDLIAGDLDVEAQFALWQRRRRRVGVSKGPVRARLQLGWPRRHFADLTAAGIQAELAFQRAGGERSRGVLVERGARPPLGQGVFDAEDIAASGDEDAPFFGALGDVAFERRDPDAPARVGKILADELLAPLVSGDGRDELPRPAAPVVNDWQARATAVQAPRRARPASRARLPLPEPG